MCIIRTFYLIRNIYRNKLIIFGWWFVYILLKIFYHYFHLKCQFHPYFKKVLKVKRDDFWKFFLMCTLYIHSAGVKIWTEFALFAYDNAIEPFNTCNCKIKITAAINFQTKSENLIYHFFNFFYFFKTFASKTSKFTEEIYNWIPENQYETNRKKYAFKIKTKYVFYTWW